MMEIVISNKKMKIRRLILVFVKKEDKFTFRNTGMAGNMNKWKMVILNRRRKQNYAILLNNFIYLYIYAGV
jgi:hypothetical protein